MQPPYPRQQGHRPCTRSAMQKTASSNIFRMVLGKTEQGAPRPPSPHQGHRPWTLSAKKKASFTFFFPHEA